MTWLHLCPKCGRASTRYCALDRKPVCSHLYHDAKDCGVCGDCRNPQAMPRYIALASADTTITPVAKL